MIKGVCGNVTVLAPASEFETWSGEEPSRPKGFVGIAEVGRASLAVFHDKETTFAISHAGHVVLIQSIYGEPPDTQQLSQLPADKWKRVDGTYTSDGGEHVLFESMYSSAQYADKEWQIDIQAEAGLPVRISIPAGRYALEVYGSWSPATNTEYALARLVPTGAATAKKAPAKKAAPKPAKTNARKPLPKKTATKPTKPAKKTKSKKR